MTSGQTLRWKLDKTIARLTIGFFLVLGSTAWAGAASTLINSSFFVRVSQSSDASSGNAALKAVDGAGGTFSLTADQPGSYWTALWGRPFMVDRIELANRVAPFDKEMDGLTLRLYNIDDQIVFQSGLTNPGSGGVHIVLLPDRKSVV